MSEANIWQLIVSVLMTATAALVTVLYKDVIRRISNMEKKLAAVLMTQLVQLNQNKEVSPELLKALREAISESV